MVLNISVIFSSVREGRNGIKAAKFVVNKLKERGHKVDLIDPQVYKIPLLKKIYDDYPKGKAPKNLEDIHKIFDKSDGFIVVSAEYNHSIPPALSNLIDHFGDEFCYKPSGIACYSTGSFGGVRAAMQLRALLPEIGMPSIPTIFPMSRVDTSFNDSGKDLTGDYDKRIINFLDEFEWYTNALKEARKNGIPEE
ncbi:NAD(P)H-dependent oxidoreductase [Candidatus Woesearchaeota archaeon]|nr:NAD(P)H-dependent oxidoreductase [Candidatus Woesearchaeota archaeon]